MLETLRKIETEGELTQLDNICKKPTVNINLMVKEETHSLKTQKKVSLPACTTLIQHSATSYNQCNKARKGKKRIQIGKDKIKLSLFTGDMIPYIESSKESTQKTLLEIASQLNKVIEYKINVQKSIVFLYTSNAHVDIKIKNTIPFTITQKMKCLSVNLTQYVQDIHAENYKTFIKKSMKI